MHGGLSTCSVGMSSGQALAVSAEISFVDLVRIAGILLLLCSQCQKGA